MNEESNLNAFDKSLSGAVEVVAIELFEHEYPDWEGRWENDEGPAEYHKERYRIRARRIVKMVTETLLIHD